MPCTALPPSLPHTHCRNDALDHASLQTAHGFDPLPPPAARCRPTSPPPTCCRITHPPPLSQERIKAAQPKTIILSGGPNSVHVEGAPRVPDGFFEYCQEQGIAVLGICYGMQVSACAA